MDQAQNALPIYTCHKQVQAMKISHVGQLNDGVAYLNPENSIFMPIAVGVEYLEKHEPVSGGYYVLYPDG